MVIDIDFDEVDASNKFPISYSMLNYVTDVKTLFEYIYRKDTSTIYTEIGKKLHGNLSNDFIKVKIGKENTKSEKDIFLTPHTVSTTYYMSNALESDRRFLNMLKRDHRKEYKIKGILNYHGYKFNMKVVLDMFCMDSGNIYEFKTTAFYRKETVEKYNYDMQAYIYKLFAEKYYKQKYNVQIKDSMIIFISKQFPYNSIFKKLTNADLERGEDKFKKKIEFMIDLIESRNLENLFFIK